jgi:hypothetical protein
MLFRQWGICTTDGNHCTKTPKDRDSWAKMGGVLRIRWIWVHYQLGGVHFGLLFFLDLFNLFNPPSTLLLFYLLSAMVFLPSWGFSIAISP